MLANCLLSVGMLSLVVRCALAAEGKLTAATCSWETRECVALTCPVTSHISDWVVVVVVRVDLLFHAGRFLLFVLPRTCWVILRDSQSVWTERWSVA